MRELEKHSNSFEKQQTIKEFLAWIAREKHWFWAEWSEYDTERAVLGNTDTIVFEFFGIDKDKLEEERRELLEKQRQLSG